MSRCFPYTPLNYKKEDGSPVGSIEKLQNGRGNTKQRKEPSTKQRKEPSQRTNEKPSKKRSRDECGNLDSSEHKSKKRREAEKKTKPNGSSGDLRKDHCEHFERSDLSEEHNPPAFVPNHCSSMPGTPKSSKKNAVQAADPNGKRPSMVLRIKLPLKKHNDPQPVSTCKVPCSSAQLSTSSKTHAVVTEYTPQLKLQFPVTEAPCFSGRPAESPAGIMGAEPSNRRHVKKRNDPQPVATCKDPCSSAQLSTSSKSQVAVTEYTPQLEPCFSGRAAEAPADIMKAEPSNPRHGRRHGHRIRKLERRFGKLIVDWKPPPLQLNEEEDLDWLFASRRQPKKDGESCARISKAAPIPEPSACLVPTDSLQPRACYLPEFDMYQLPYVIPF